MSSPNDAGDKADQAPKSPLPRPMGREGNSGGGSDADVERYGAPEVGADRDAPGRQAAPGERDEKTRKPPLEIRQIEDLEDDAMGG